MCEKNERIIPEMRLPDKLQSGDRIGVIAPSAPVDLPEPLIQRGYTFLEEKGFEVVEGENFRSNTGDTAGSIQDRVESIHSLVTDPSIKAIMSFWGGYNTTDLLDHVDFDLIRKNPKLFVGYSDFSALTLAITHKTNLITYYGPSVITFTKPTQFDYTWDSFEATCMTAHPLMRLQSSDFYTDDLHYISTGSTSRELKENHGYKTFQEGSAGGRVVAGNLMALTSLLGTEFCPDFDDKILFLEASEYANRGMIKRSLTQLRQSNAFAKANGVVLGRFMSQSGFQSEEQIEAMFHDIFAGYEDLPVLYHADFGHSDPMITIPNGGICSIDTSQDLIMLSE